MKKKMKKLNLKVLVLLAVIILTIPATSVKLFAGSGKKNPESRIYQERMQQAESYINSPMQVKFDFTDSYRIYDAHFNLIYETASVNDQKLQWLLMKSDLIADINNTHIFQLSR